MESHRDGGGGGGGGALYYRGRKIHSPSPRCCFLAERGKSPHVPKVSEKMVGIILTGSKLLHTNLFLHYVKYLGRGKASQTALRSVSGDSSRFLSPRHSESIYSAALVACSTTGTLKHLGLERCNGVWVGGAWVYEGVGLIPLSSPLGSLGGLFSFFFPHSGIKPWLGKYSKSSRNEALSGLHILLLLFLWGPIPNSATHWTLPLTNKHSLLKSKTDNGGDKRTRSSRSELSIQPEMSPFAESCRHFKSQPVLLSLNWNAASEFQLSDVTPVYSWKVYSDLSHSRLSPRATNSRDVFAPPVNQCCDHVRDWFSFSLKYDSFPSFSTQLSKKLMFDMSDYSLIISTLIQAQLSKDKWVLIFLF